VATSDVTRRALEQRALLDRHFSADVLEETPIPTRPSGPAPLSYIQRQMWLHQLLVPHAPLYNEPITIHRHGALDISLLQRCLTEIVRRHEAWRTTFEIIAGEPKQVVGPPREIELPLIDLRRHPARVRETEALRVATEDARQPFDVTRGPLFRGLVVRLDDAEYRLYLTLHHMIFDGVSTYNVLLPELTALYDAFSIGEPSPLAELPTQYADFAWWQQNETARVADRDLAYWRGQLAGAPALIDLPTDRPRPAVQTFRGGMVAFNLRKELVDRLRAVAAANRVTLFMLLLGSFQVLVRRYGAQEDIVVGTVSGDRKRSEFEGLLGCFLNPVVLRTDVSGNPTFRDLLVQVRDVTLSALSHDGVPFELLVRELAPRRDPSRNPLYQVLFSVEPPMPPLAPGWELTQIDLETGTAKFDLYLELDARSTGLLGRFMFNTDLFERATVERLSTSWQTLLRGIADDPGQAIWQLPVIGADERARSAAKAKRVLDRGTGIAGSSADEANSIPERFEAIVRDRGQHLAVRAGDGDWTYDDLNASANRVGRALDTALRPDDERVALYLPHDGRMLGGILGVLKTGRAYVPLDPGDPPARTAAKLHHSQAGAVLTCGEHDASARHVAGHGLPIFLLDDLGTDGERENLERRITTDAIAYLLYTSGSTGAPKAVVQTHGNVLHFVRAYTNALQVTARDRLTLLSSYGFDAAVIDVFTALLNGASLHPIDLRSEGFTGLAAAISRDGITIYHSVPTVFRHFEASLADNQRFSNVRAVVLGGEEARRSDFEAFRRRFGPDATFVNLAGQAESSLNSLNVIAWDADVTRERISMGDPVEETELVLLGPDGAPTELYGEIGVRSSHVALGYWREADLSARAFLHDSNGVAGRTYRSGDLARALPDGTFEFAGRIDLQTKVAGARIEPKEIETHLARHAGLRDCAVAVRPDSTGEPRLVAYLVATDRARVPDEELRAYLQQLLPAYMVPSTFVWLDRIPLTASNKIDRLALPAPTAERRAVAITSPRDDLERGLVAIWEAVLGRRPIGISDDFFELGGHSLLAVGLFDRIRREIGLQLPLSLLLEAPTIGRFANRIRGGHSLDGSGLVAVQPKGTQRPLFIVPGVGSRIFYLRNLARHLGSDQPLYALNQPPNGIAGHTDRRLEDLARQYVAAMREVQPQGPYDLVGYSFGGPVAYEVAQQIVAGGESVGLLALIDSRHPEQPLPALGFHPSFVPRRVANQIRIVRRLGLRSGAAYLQRRLRIARINSLAAVREVLEPRLPPRLARVVGNPTLEAERAWLAADVRALHRYCPRPYPGRLTFLWAEHSQRPPAIYDTKQGWQEIALGGMDVRPIPGSHLTVLEEPLARVTAGVLGDALAASRAAASRDAPADDRSAQGPRH
jgi:amino acid adenylation domain-containing protein